MKSTQLASISNESPAFCGPSICRWLATRHGTEWVSSRRWASLATEGKQSTSSSVSSTSQGLCEKLQDLWPAPFHMYLSRTLFTCNDLLLLFTAGPSIKEEIQRWWWRWTSGWAFLKKKIINSVWYKNELLAAIWLLHLCKIRVFYAYYCRLHSLKCACF